MLYWAVMFLCTAPVAAVFGFGGIASTATGMAQILFVVALAHPFPDQRCRRVRSPSRLVSGPGLPIETLA
jgi:uncharacterized membrane protein YtjA (UPF0391 family)